MRKVIISKIKGEKIMQKKRNAESLVGVYIYIYKYFSKIIIRNKTTNHLSNIEIVYTFNNNLQKEKNNKRGLICTFETKSGEPFYAEKKLKSKKIKIKDST